uniref:Interleukin 9 receptor n=1 Tax=Aotus nancymaae TaxID=37293 RepID=A0A2K5CYV4_AOTNA
RAQHRDRIVGVTRLILEAFELDPGFIHEARLRVQMATTEDDVGEEERYTGQWSEWSQPVSFQAPQRQGPVIPRSGRPDSILIVSVFLLLTGLICLLFKLSPRVKRTFSRNVPSPAAFFQPLYNVHNGNFQTWVGAHRTGMLLNHDCAGTPRGASEARVHEAVALLTCGPVYPWKSVCLEEDQENPGTSVLGKLSSEDVLPAGGTEWGAEPLAYLPQEGWPPTSPARPAPPDSEGSSDYCGVLDCYGGRHPSTFPRNTQSSGPTPTLARGVSREHQGLETQQGGAWMLAAHCQRPGLHEEPQGTSPRPVFSKPRSWTF